MTLLVGEDVSVAFGTGSWLPWSAGRRLEVVRGASLAVAPGEAVAVVGESGSGKTTLSRALARLLPLAGGRVTFDGADVTNATGARLQALRRQVAFMFQDAVSSLSPRRTVRAQVLEPFAIHQLPLDGPDEMAAALLDRVGLSRRLLAAYPHQLSGGQARRVGVARALAAEPRLVIADEPTAGLDVSVQNDLLNLFGRLRREYGLAFVVVSHNLAVVRHVSQRIAVMYLGRIVETGPTAAVLAAPAHPYTAALIASVPVPDPARRRGGPAIGGEVPSLFNRPAGCAFHTRCPRADALCRREEPPVVAVGAGRAVLCHHPLDPPSDAASLDATSTNAPLAMAGPPATGDT